MKETCYLVDLKIFIKILKINTLKFILMNLAKNKL
jgi:hypothetical protein